MRMLFWTYVAKDIPFTPDAPYYLVFHDRDLAEDPASIGRLLDGLGAGIRYMSANEYSGYLHAKSVRRRGRSPDRLRRALLRVFQVFAFQMDASPFR